jgi:hypothetical protein
MKKALAIALVALAPTLAQAQTTIFSDNFESSPLGLNTAPSGWTVTDGTVDVVVTGTFGLTGSGRFVDLDGSTSDAGVLSRSFALTAGTTYTAFFDIAGNQRGGSDNLQISFGSAGLSLNPLLSTTPWTPYSLTFTPTASGNFSLSFNNAGGDNVGALLDNVSVQAVPEPESYALLLAGLGLMGTIARRRKASVASA